MALIVYTRSGLPLQYNVSRLLRANRKPGNVDIPFLVVDLGRHDVILGRLWLTQHRVLADCAGRRLLWPDEVSLEDEIISKHYVSIPRQILQRPVVLAQHQRDADRRDQAMDRMGFHLGLDSELNKNKDKDK